MDNCPERMDAADAEAPRLPRIETAVEFCSGVEAMARMQAAVDTCLERMYAETAGLTMRFFWCAKKKNKQKQEAL